VRPFLKVPFCSFVVAAACASPPPVPPQIRHNIVLVTIDTIRADRVGTGFTPTLDALASRGLRFTHARSVAPLTLPAHVSILTGQLPMTHGVRLNGVPRPRDGGAPLARRLRDAGYSTGAVVGAFVLDRRFGLDDGFEHFDDRIGRDPAALDRLQADRRANEVIDAALRWLGQTAAAQPWLLWVHLYDPHAPYDPPAASRALANGDAYNGEIAFVDAELQRLFGAVSARADAARTAIIVTGDHGESLGEHGEPTHGMLLFEAALRVPLIVYAPGHASIQRTEPASSIDIVPTALALAALERDTTLPGQNLLEPFDVGREIYAETEYPMVAGWAAQRALIQDRWKLLSGAQQALYDLVADPGEHTTLIAARASLAQAMQARLTTSASGPPTGAASSARRSSVDPDTASRLRALGYVAPVATTAPRHEGADPPVDIESWAAFERALAMMEAGRAQDVLATLASLVAAHPESPIFHTTYARALAVANRSRDALSMYRKAVARWATDATLYHELAVLARDAGLANEAQRAEQAALTLDPAFPPAHNGLGLLHTDSDRHDEAQRAFEQAVRLDPTNASYMVNLGNAHRALAQLDQAAIIYRRALDRDPSLADAANGLGVVLVQQGRAAEAVRWLEQAVSRDPAFVEAQLNLGIAFEQNGQRDRALAQYRLVQRLAPGRSRESDAARALLRELERR
jgi:choline-sulfatase